MPCLPGQRIVGEPVAKWREVDGRERGERRRCHCPAVSRKRRGSKRLERKATSKPISEGYIDKIGSTYRHQTAVGTTFSVILLERVGPHIPRIGCAFIHFNLKEGS
jgi:hypothetical protein